MEVTLPSGNTARFKDKMMRGDIVEARRGMKFVTAPDGSRTVDGSFIDNVAGRVITCMLVEWSFPATLPRNAASDDLAQRILNETLDDNDSLAMDMAVAPWVNRIVTISTSGHLLTHNATGTTVTVSDPASLASLLATGEFTQAEGAGPKAATRTAITSAESPDGLTLTEPGLIPSSLT